MDLQERSALVTGASRGLGEALARRLARRGAKVVLVARDAAAVEAAALAIRQQGGVAHAIAADVADKVVIHRIAGAASALVGAIDVLIHNASALGPTPLRLLLDTECEDLERVLQTNLVGPFRLTKALAGAMALHGSGVIVGISSDAARGAYPTWGAYGASKAALDQLMNVWAAELATMGVRTLMVDPGEMDTRMHREAFGEAHDPKALARPDDVAGTIVAMIEDDRRAPAGSRLEASRWATS